MTKEEYADYAITFLYLRGGPMPEIINTWRAKGAPAWWGVKHACKATNNTLQWDTLTPNYGYRCASRREAALRYCWKHGLIKRNRREHTWTEEDLQNLRDPDTQA